MIDDNKYVFFKSQLKYDYDILIIDDYAFGDVHEHYPNKESIRLKFIMRIIRTLIGLEFIFMNMSFIKSSIMVKMILINWNGK